mmetsp:Transcript_42725/g.106743  ORF Transcript_42725/g.106743 Transcript_42725/m.106743 type:complete len:300 (+) Transcript_42725:984-1883(+)
MARSTRSRHRAAGGCRQEGKNRCLRTASRCASSCSKGREDGRKRKSGNTTRRRKRFGNRIGSTHANNQTLTGCLVPCTMPYHKARHPGIRNRRCCLKGRGRPRRAFACHSYRRRTKCWRGSTEAERTRHEPLIGCEHQLAVLPLTHCCPTSSLRHLHGGEADRRPRGNAEAKAAKRETMTSHGSPSLTARTRCQTLSSATGRSLPQERRVGGTLPRHTRTEETHPGRRVSGRECRGILRAVGGERTTTLPLPALDTRRRHRWRRARKRSRSYLHATTSIREPGAACQTHTTRSVREEEE